jgi:phospholipase/carboxylesterase
LLHGSGGDEHHLVPLAEKLAPGSPMLGVRGTVAIDGGFAFFHWFPDRTLDEADIVARIPILAGFIEAASPLQLHQGADRHGFSNVPSWRRPCS